MLNTTHFIAIGIVLISGFFHALWNVLAKKSRDKTAFLISIQCLSLLFFLPWAMMLFKQVVWHWQVVLIFVLSLLMHGLYFLILSRAYSVGHISQIYPIARGSSALVAPFSAVFFLGEHLTIIGWIGVAGIVTGVILLGDLRWRQSINQHVLLAISMGLCIASYIIIDRMALKYTSPILVNWIGTVGNILVLSFFLRSKQTLKREWKKNRSLIFIGCILAPLSYLLFLQASSMTQVAQLAPIREIGTVFGVALGVLFLKEPKAKKRIVASVMVVVGIIFLGINR